MSNRSIVVISSDGNEGWRVQASNSEECRMRVDCTLGEVIGEIFMERGDGDPVGKTTVLPLHRGQRGAKIVFSAELISEHNCWLPSPSDEHYRLEMANLFRKAAINAHEAYCHRGWSVVPSSPASRDIESILDWTGHSECRPCSKAFHAITGDAYWAATHHLMDVANGIAAQLVTEQPVSIAWLSNVRDLIEAAGKVIWLTDPLPGAEPTVQVFSRLARLLLEEFKNISESNRYAATVNNDEAYFRHYAKAAGFDFVEDNQGEVICLEIPNLVTERRPRSSSLVSFIRDEVIADTAWGAEDWDTLYGLGSAVTHARFYAMRQFRDTEGGRQGIDAIGILGPTLAAFQVALNRIGWRAHGSIAIRPLAELHRKLRSDYLELRAHANLPDSQAHDP